ncbi:hypothetical protein WR25_22223 [Diploscapter pachys]|uniref:MARVEL domain-containing protein n=1 Tax=Diploscapter pachys TaxID=2018661 RepID=A0A2A2KS22_9BILA|nr:hypothetical protein WR25_22223 [Diploscapter pachys]
MVDNISHIGDEHGDHNYDTISVTTLDPVDRFSPPVVIPSSKPQKQTLKVAPKPLNGGPKTANVAPMPVVVSPKSILEKDQLKESKKIESDKNENEKICDEKKLGDLNKMHEPRYHTTTTVVEETQYYEGDGRPTYSYDLPSISCDLSYLRTLGGIMKLLCILGCILTFIFTMAGPGHFSGAGWATFVSSIGLVVTSVLLTLYIFRIVDNLPNVPWIIMEMCFCFAWCIFFFIAACVLAVVATKYSATLGWAIASFFAFGCMCAYGFDCYLKFLAWKNNEKATGGGEDFIAQQQRRRQQNI